MYLGQQLPSATGTSKQAPSSGTIYSILKSLLKDEKQNEFILLSMSRLRSHLFQEGILSHVKFTEYTNMSEDEQAMDYLRSVLTRKRENCFKFLFCLQNEKEHIGHEELLEHVLSHCNGMSYNFTFSLQYVYIQMLVNSFHTYSHCNKIYSFWSVLTRLGLCTLFGNFFGNNRCIYKKKNNSGIMGLNLPNQGSKFELTATCRQTWGLICEH